MRLSGSRVEIRSVAASYEPHLEIYQPAYLFTTNANGASSGYLAHHHQRSCRPSITATIFRAQTPDAANISSVVMLRNSSVNSLPLIWTSGWWASLYPPAVATFSVTGPPNGNIAPTGFLHALPIQQLRAFHRWLGYDPFFVLRWPPAPPPPPGITYVQSNGSTTQTSGIVRSDSLFRRGPHCGQPETRWK